MAMARRDGGFFQGARIMFYLVTPNETSFPREDDVPKYVQEATPFFIGLILLEMLAGWLKTGRSVGSVSDGTTSISAGMVSRLPHLFIRSLEVSTYVYFWENFHVLELPWDSAWTWWLGFLGVDFCYYWVHRCAHELNILWAAHQVHHSSDYYNLSTALRQSVTQQCASWIFYLPLALVMPPSVFAVHVQFNLLYQFWIHTEVVRDLGPLEWVLNTPSHHRVHHGRNPYCIDKNYGGTLIIWDRLFGTFAPESEKVVYGLVHPVHSFDILSVQFHYYPYVWRKYWRAKGLVHKLSAIFKGPSWRPGLPRLGDRSEVPKVTGKEVPLDSLWSPATQAYVTAHFFLLLGVYNDLFASKAMLSQMTVLLVTSYVFFSLTSLGYIIDQRPNASIVETLRCALMMLLQRYGFIRPLVASLSVPIEAFTSLSMLYWAVQSGSHLMVSKRKQQ